MRRLDLRSERGQSLLMFLVTLPVLLGFAALVIDGANAFGAKRKAQNLADATALAAAQSILGPTGTCPTGPPTIDSVQTAAECYSQLNGGPSVVDPCTTDDPTDPDYRPDPGAACYTWPYKGDSNRVEVRITRAIDGFFVNAIGLGSIFGNGAFARAVASVLPVTTTACQYPPAPDSDPPNMDCVIPGSAGHCEYPEPPASDPPNSDCVVPGGAEYCSYPAAPGSDPPNGDCVIPGETGTCNFPPAPASAEPNENCVIPGTGSQQGTRVDATTATCSFTEPVPNPSQYYPSCVGPTVGGIDGAVAFVMSRACDAITYQGAGGGTVGALATNGGLRFAGAKPKKVRNLGYNRSGCPNDPARPPSGDASACTATAPAWGDPTDSDNLCAKELTDLSAQVPLNWPLTPPTIPTPLSAGETWDPSIHYPSRCVNLGTGNVTFSPSSGPPRIYCLTGSGSTLTLNGNLDSGDGYTFFALGGGQILISSNGTKVKYYWPSGPSACGARPTGRPASYTCFGRTISGYDPQTLFYATNTAHDSNCNKNAICINGQNTELNGDMFAVAPSTFPPPSPTVTGGTVFMAGGSASAGSGFIESWWLAIQGNTGSYTGTGTNVGGHQPVGTPVDATPEHCVFDPPVPNPNDYLPSCVVPGTNSRYGTLEGATPTRYGTHHEAIDTTYGTLEGASPTRYGTLHTDVVPVDYGMDE